MLAIEFVSDVSYLVLFIGSEDTDRQIGAEDGTLEVAIIGSSSVIVEVTVGKETGAGGTTDEDGSVPYSNVKPDALCHLGEGCRLDNISDADAVDTPAAESEIA